MIETVFRFGVVFNAVQPAEAQAELAQKLRALPGVQLVDAGTITERCPLATMQIKVEVASVKEAGRLLGKITRTIQREPDTAVTSRDYNLTDLCG